MTYNDVEVWKMLKNALELDSKYSQMHIDFCNVTTIVRNRKLGDLFAMTWRWVKHIFLHKYLNVRTTLKRHLHFMKISPGMREYELHFQLLSIYIFYCV